MSSDSGIDKQDMPLLPQDEPCDDEGYFGPSPCPMNPVMESIFRLQGGF
jgi:hypothetical protein